MTVLLSPHFTLKEFTDSDMAARRRIDNSLPQELMEEAKKTAAMMERIRDYLGGRAGRQIPISISSGYRCKALNEAVGGGDSSDHIKMMAIDFKAPSFGSPLQVSHSLAMAFDELKLGQLIYEHTWIHVSSRAPTRSINKILTVQGDGYAVGIRP